MASSAQALVRPAELADRQALLNLVQFESYVHRHLDWRPALDWLGQRPFWVAEQRGRIVAALACPPDAPEPAWIRVYANASSFHPTVIWPMLWEAAQAELAANGVSHAAAIVLHPWFESLLQKNDFVQNHQVVTLSWQVRSAPQPRPFPGEIRPMTPGDLPAVQAVDNTAFASIWRISGQSLALAYEQARLATVLELDGRIIGYQITTGNLWGGHLARLAVSPAIQRQGAGFALVQNLMQTLAGQRAMQLTVNTQSHNHASLALYESIGFQRTGETYPVYEFLI